MKLKDLILVTNNNKGAESRYLSSIEEYMAVLFQAFAGSETEIAHAVGELCRTKDSNLWTEVYTAANKSFCARFCRDEQELRDFLMGYHKMAGKKTAFDRDACAKESLDVLTAYNMDCAGRPLVEKLHYERQERRFRQGETLHNLNGSDYSVLMVLSENDLLLMALGSGQFLIAEGTREYARYPKEGTYSADSVTRGIEWDSGIYLGNDLSVIDLDNIRKEYAEANEEYGADEEMEH